MTLKFNGERVFRVGQRLAFKAKPTTKPKTKKEDKEVNANAAITIINALAEGILARAKDEKRQLASSQPEPPPRLLTEPTSSRKRIEEHYEKPETIRTNVNGVESYQPPPILLAKED